MEAIARVKNLKGSARKARLVLDLVRGRNVIEAQHILTLCNKQAAREVNKLVKAAVANAEVKKTKINVDSLYINKAFADDGPMMKRHRPRAQGRATIIRKRTCHITICVQDNEGGDVGSKS
jgi:large subunit ribosomal protein L22